MRNTVHIKRIPRLIDGPAVIIEGFDVGIPRQCPSTVGIQAEFLAGFVLIEFQDSKPGVPPEDMEKIFNRFYRSEQSRNRASGGAGLGLTISRKIVEAHDGEISAHTSPLGGLAVRIKIPVF